MGGARGMDSFDSQMKKRETYALWRWMGPWASAKGHSPSSLPWPQRHGIFCFTHLLYVRFTAVSRVPAVPDPDGATAGPVHTVSAAQWPRPHPLLPAVAYSPLPVRTL